MGYAVESTNSSDVSKKQHRLHEIDNAITNLLNGCTPACRRIAMAEAITALGVVASVAQLADYGFSLSVMLFTFSQAVYSADQSIKALSNDLSLTSTVLKELSQIIGSDEARVVSEAAFRATKQAVTECLAIFEQLSTALDKSLSNLGMLEERDGKKTAKRGTVALEKLKWPFKHSKMELLRSNLDRLKASLTLKLQVLSYAREV